MTYFKLFIIKTLLIADLAFSIGIVPGYNPPRRNAFQKPIICEKLKKNSSRQKNRIITTNDSTNRHRVSHLAGILSHRSTFVDKTLFIKAFLENGNRSILLTAPSTFGKSTNLNTLKRFLEIERPLPEEKKINDDRPTHYRRNNNNNNNERFNYRLFVNNNLKITRQSEVMNQHFGRYPVVYVNLRRKPSAVNVFYGAVEFYKRAVRDSFKQHDYLLTASSSSSSSSSSSIDNKTDHHLTQKWIRYPYSGRITDVDVIDGLTLLSRRLRNYHQKKVIVLIDSFDYPLTAIMLQDTADKQLLSKMTEFSARMIESITSDRDNVARTLITATSYTVCSRLTRLTTGLMFYRFLERHPFVDYYGLTRSDVDDLFDRCPLFDRLNKTVSKPVGRLKNQIRSWCSGYKTIDGRDIYTFEGVTKFFLTTTNKKDNTNKNNSKRNYRAVNKMVVANDEPSSSDIDCNNHHSADSTDNSNSETGIEMTVSADENLTESEESDWTESNYDSTESNYDSTESDFNWTDLPDGDSTESYDDSLTENDWTESDWTGSDETETDGSGSDDDNWTEKNENNCERSNNDRENNKHNSDNNDQLRGITDHQRSYGRNGLQRRWLLTPEDGISPVIEKKLTSVLKIDDIRSKMKRLLKNEQISITYRRNATANIVILKNLLCNPLKTTTNTDYYFSFLLELGYLTRTDQSPTKSSNDRIYLKIPNRQVSNLVGRYVANYYRRRKV